MLKPNKQCEIRVTAYQVRAAIGPENVATRGGDMGWDLEDVYIRHVEKAYNASGRTDVMQIWGEPDRVREVLNAIGAGGV